jgi:hypothetical protein
MNIFSRIRSAKKIFVYTHVFCLFFNQIVCFGSQIMSQEEYYKKLFWASNGVLLLKWQGRAQRPGEFIEEQVSLNQQQSGPRDLAIPGNLTVGGNATVDGSIIAPSSILSIRTLELVEDPANGTNSITLQAPASLGLNYTLTFPPDEGIINSVLTNNGSGILSWQSAAALGAFVQGGNSFGATATLGTQDNFGLNIITNNANRLQISNTGILTAPNLSGTGDRYVQASTSGALSAVIQTGIKNIIQVIKDTPVVTGKYYPDLFSAVSWANDNATEPTAIVIAPGDYTINTTITVTNPLLNAIYGTSVEAVTLIPASSLVGSPLFNVTNSVASEFFGMHELSINGLATPGWASTAGSVGILISGDSNFSIVNCGIVGCYRGIEANGGSATGSQFVFVTDSRIGFSGDCNVLADNGTTVNITTSLLEGAGNEQVRSQRTNALAPQTEVICSVCQFSSPLGTGNAILAKDVSRVRSSNSRLFSLEHIFTAEDNAVIESVRNLEVDGSLTNYRQLDGTARILINGCIVANIDDLSKYVVTNPANVLFNIVDNMTGVTSLGSFTSSDNILNKVFTGNGVDDPILKYSTGLSGSRGLWLDLSAAALGGAAGLNMTTTVNTNVTGALLTRGTNTSTTNSASFVLGNYDGTDDTFSNTSLLKLWFMSKLPTSHNLLFSFIDGLSFITPMVITGSGNVGIGLTFPATPTSKLELGAGQLSVPLGNSTVPSYTFTGDLNTGIYSPGANIIGFSTDGLTRFSVNETGVINIAAFTTAGVVHNNAGGDLSTSLIVNADIASATITDDKLATITTAGKVANSATTATSANMANAIVARDGSGNFNAGTITANLTGIASENVAKAGDTMSGNLVMGNQSQLQLQELLVNGINTISLQAPALFGADYTLTLPTSSGNANQALITNGGNPTAMLSWAEVPSVSNTIINGGNAFSAPITIGTNDNFGLNLETNGTSHIQISNAGTVSIAGLSGTGDRYVQANATGDLSAVLPTGIQNMIQVVSGVPVVAGKYYPDIASAVNYANANATVPTVIQIAPGIYPISSTVTVTNNNLKSIVGTEAFSVIIMPTVALVGQPIFILNQTGTGVPFELKDMSITGLGITGWKTTSGSSAIRVTGSANFGINHVAIGNCYCGVEALGAGGGSSVQRVVLNNCAISDMGDCAVLADNGAHVIALNNILQIPGSELVRVQQTNALAPQTEVYISGGECNNNTTGTGNAIVVKDTALARVQGCILKNLENIFTVQDSAVLQTISNISVDGSNTNYRQLTGSAELVASNDIVFNANDLTKYLVSNSTNVLLRIIDADNGRLLIGNFADSDSPIIGIFNGHGIDDPTFNFKEDWFGSRGLVYESPAASLNGVTSAMGLTSAFNNNVLVGALVRGASAHSSVPAFTMSTYQSTGDPATPDLSLLRRWTIEKQATTHNLRTSFWDGASETVNSTLTPTGNLGLKTTAPNSTLEIGSGQVAVPAGTAVNPSYTFTGDADTGIFSSAADTINFTTGGTQRMSVNAGVINIASFTTAGVVHNNASGNLSSSLIVNADVDPAAAIVDTKLATISTAGKVANSATTATASNVPNTIVLRNGSGDFTAGTITANITGDMTGNVTGNVTGAASLNVLKSGDTMTGSLTLSGGSTNLTVGGTTDVQALDVHGNFHAFNATTFDQGVPGIALNELYVTKGAISGPNQFNSVKAALDSIVGSSVTNQFAVRVGPGVFTEDTMTIPSWTTIIGESFISTIIQTDSPSKDLFIAGPQTALINLRLQGATDSGKSAIIFNGGGSINISGLAFHSNNICLNLDSTVSSVMVCNLYSSLFRRDAEFATGIKVRSTSFPAIVTINGLGWNGIANPSLQNILDVSGSQVTIFCDGAEIGGRVPIAGTGCSISDGAEVTFTATAFRNLTTGINVINSGAGPSLNVNGSEGISNTNDIIINHPLTKGSINGTFEQNKISINPLASVSAFLVDPIATGTVTIGPRFAGNTVSSITNVSIEQQQGSAIGVISGGVLSAAGGLNVSATAGSGYLMVGAIPNDTLRYITWNSQTITLPANSDSFVYIDNTGTLQSALSRPNPITTILLGKVRTEGGSFAFIQKVPENATHPGNDLDQTLRTGLGPIYTSGSITTKNGFLGLDVSQGNYFFGSLTFTPTGGTGISWESFYGPNGINVINGVTAVDYENYDNAGILTAIPANNYARHALYVVGDGTTEQYMLVYGQTTYATLNDAQNGGLPPTPGTWSDNIALIASIIVFNNSGSGGPDANSIAEITDERPRLAFQSGGATSVTCHSSLSCLLADDHPQYLLVNGTRSMSGDLSLGGNDIVNVAAGTAALPSISFSGSGTTGFSVPSTNTLVLSTAGTNQLQISNAGVVRVANLASTGVVHSNASGDLSTSLIVNNDITLGTIGDDKLQSAISTTNTPNTIVKRDGSGNFVAGTITASLTGSASNNVLKAGDTMTGTLNINAGVGNALVINTDKFIINSATGNTTIGGILTLSPLTTPGVLHNNGSGVISSSLIVDGDITNGTITDAKLSTITTAGKVANSATTATNTNVANAIVARDGAGSFNSNSILLENQGQLQLQELSSNGNDTISLRAPAALGTSYVLTLPVNAGTVGQILSTDGSGNLSWVSQGPGAIVNGGNAFTTPIVIGTTDDFGVNFITNNSNRLQISNTGGVTINGLNSTGVLHTDNNGLLSTSLIVNADISTIAAIADTKLATINTAGKVANSATTATATNTAGAIVARNGAGDFSAGVITASFVGNLTGNVTGSASNNVLKSGDTMTGNLLLANQKQLQLQELTVNGTTSVALQAPGLLPSSYALTMPTDTGAANQVLATNGGTPTATLSWISVPSIANTVVNGGNTFGATMTIGTNDANILHLRTNGVNALSIADGGGSNPGAVTISNLNSTGVVHNNAAGLLTTSLIVNADVSPIAAIADTKLAQLTTTGKVANSATTATASNTANAIVARDGSGNFNAGTITANLIGNVTGAASSNVLKTGDTMTGDLIMANQQKIQLQQLLANGTDTISLQAPASFTPSYTLVLPTNAGAANQVLTSNGSGVLSWQTASSLPNVVRQGGNTFGVAMTIGSTDNNAFNLITNNANRIVVSNAGTVTIPNLSSTGVVHTSSAGLLSTSLIVNADVDPAAGIVDTKLATISTAGKVSNSATTANTSNNPNTIVLRDGSGNFSAGTISAAFIGNVTGNVTGSASNNVLKAGDTMTGNLTLPAGTAAAPSLRFTGSTTTGFSAATTNTLVASTAGVARLTIDPSGNTTYTSNYKANVRLSSNQTISGAGTATIQFNTITYDLNNNFDTGTFLYTAPVTGYYFVAANISATYSNNNTRTLNLLKNGATVVGYSINLQGASSSSPSGNAYTTIINLTAGDTLGFQVVNAGGTVVMQANATNMIIHFMSI